MSVIYKITAELSPYGMPSWHSRDLSVTIPDELPL